MKDRFDKWTLAAIVLLAVLLRVPSFLMPIWNVDESGKAVIADVILQGGVPYRDAVDHRAPLTYYVYAATFAAFGKNNMFALRLVLTGLVAILVLIVHRLGRLAIGRRGAAFAALAFAVLASFSFKPDEMYAFHTEWTLILFTSLGALLLLRGVTGVSCRGLSRFSRSENGTVPLGVLCRGLSRFSLSENGTVPLGGICKFLPVLLSGACFALAVFSKQPAALDLLAALLFLCYLAVMAARGDGPEPIRRVAATAALLLAGAAAVCVAWAAYFLAAGAWDGFVFYAYTYNTRYYVAGIPLWSRLCCLPSAFLEAAAPFNLGGLAVAAALIVLGRLGSVRRTAGRRRHAQVFLILWAGCSFAATGLSGRAFGHYFIQLLPSWCLLAGLAVQTFLETLEAAAAKADGRHAGRIKAAGLVLLASLIVLPGVIGQEFNLRAMHYQLTRKDPALDQAVRYIRQNCGEDEKIFVWGYVPRIYVLAGRDPASRFLYCNFLTGLIPWTNVAPEINTSESIVPGTRQTLIEELRSNRPAMIVDTSPGNYRHYAKYPIADFPALKGLIAEDYVPVGEFSKSSGEVMIAIYARRDSSATP